MAVQLEELLASFVIARLAVTDLPAARRNDDDAADAARDAEVEDLMARKRELASAYGSDPNMSIEEWKVARAPIDARLAELDRQCKRRATPPPQDVITGARDAQKWDSLPPQRRNALIRTYVEAVIVHPARNLGGRFDPSRIQVIPRA